LRASAILAVCVALKQQLGHLIIPTDVQPFLRVGLSTERPVPHLSKKTGAHPTLQQEDVAVLID